MNDGRLHILIVEDSPADYALIRQMLEGLREYSCEISHCETLKDSLELIHHKRVDLVLLDLALPDSQGKHTFDQVLEVAGETPVVILSGLNDSAVALDAVKVGAQDYLVKGEFDEKLLLKSILYGLERKKNTRLLKQSRETYRLLFDENPLPILICDKHTSHIIRINLAAASRFGYSEEELEGKAWKELLPQDGNADLELDPTQTRIFRFLRKDGESLFAECRSRELEYEGRQCLLIIADDITERRKVQEEVMFQSNILSSVREPVIVVDRNGLVIYWNEAASDAFGYTSETVAGRSINILYPEIDKGSLNHELKEILSGKLVQWESKLVTHEHSLVWIDNRVSLLRGEYGEVLGIIRICKDITRQRRSGELLKETAAMLDSVFNNVIQGIVLMDVNFRIKTFNITANKQAAYLMGMELQSGKSFLDYLIAEMHPAYLKHADRVMQSQQENWEMSFHFSGTSTHWFDFSLNPVLDEQDGSVRSLCLSMVDITERKLVDERFRSQYHEIENANRDLDRVVKVLSHDLRAPMNSISGLITLARDEKDHQEFGNYLNMMEKSVQKLDKFTSEMIHSLKQRGTNSEKLNLATMVNEIFDELRFAKNGNTVQLISKLPEDLSIDTDPVQLRIILSNLISNAIKYHDSHKDQPYIRVQAIEEPGFIEILAEDNGIGIAPEHVAKIFEAHYTVAPSGEQSKGLGLANVQNAVEKIGGTIWVHSIPGTGSTFRFRIPQH